MTPTENPTVISSRIGPYGVKYTDRSVLAKRIYLDQAYWARAWAAVVPTNMRNMESPIASALLLKMLEIMKPNVASTMMLRTLNPYCMTISDNIPLLDMPSGRVTMISGLMAGSPYAISPTMMLAANRNSKVTSVNSRTAMYLESNMVLLEIGRISSCLIVPHLNSLATMPPAIMMTNRLTSDVVKRLSRTKLPA